MSRKLNNILIIKTSALLSDILNFLKDIISILTKIVIIYELLFIQLKKCKKFKLILLNIGEANGKRLVNTFTMDIT